MKKKAIAFCLAFGIAAAGQPAGHARRRILQLQIPAGDNHSGADFCRYIDVSVRRIQISHIVIHIDV